MIFIKNAFRMSLENDLSKFLCAPFPFYARSLTGWKHLLLLKVPCGIEIFYMTQVDKPFQDVPTERFFLTVQTSLSKKIKSNIGTLMRIETTSYVSHQSAYFSILLDFISVVHFREPSWKKRNFLISNASNERQKFPSMF